MRREDIRARAVHAAAAVSLILSAGCAGHVDVAEATGGAVGSSGSGGERSIAGGGAGGSEMADSGLTDAGPDADLACSESMPSAQWEACCIAWRNDHPDASPPWAPGCAPWGPPMPPPMPEVMA
jgi:hypothetical protein